MAFVQIPDNPVPAGAEELWFEGRGGLRLRGLYAPAQAARARGSVLLFNGRTEFVEKYFEVIGELQARGFAVFSMDWRGQGLSDRLLPNRLKGHLTTLDDPVNDVATAVRSFVDRLPRPHVVVAHSMGGGIALRALQTRRIEADAAIFSAPMWGIANLSETALKFSRFMTSLGLGGVFAPGVAKKWRRERFKRNPVTHDKTRFNRAQDLIQANQDLALAGVTLGWVEAAATACEGFRQPGSLAHLRFPVVVLSAEQESLVDNASHTAVAKLLPNATVVEIMGAKHEILQETDDIRAQFWREFDGLLAQLSQPA